ncbi:hypothetical protein HYW20_00410 [Candidatus Woesearchaeota archaeon]|nr:hypothetical protein [Candidatus Woesearchaeota archaeon]
METALKESREAEILSEIRDAEKKSDEIIEKAGREKESMLHQASFNASKMLIAKEDEIRKLQEKKLVEFRDKARLIKEEKIAEGRGVVKQLKAKAEKNIPKAVEFMLKKFGEMV